MPNSDEIRDVFARIKEALDEEKKKIDDIESLVNKKIERDAGLWEFGFDELEAELFRRFSSLEEKEDCLSVPVFSSPRKGVGKLIVFMKKAILKITRPYTRMILDRQDRFNRELIPILLAEILLLQKIKDRLNAAEGQINELLENMQELSGTCFEMSKSKDKTKKS